MTPENFLCTNFSQVQPIKAKPIAASPSVHETDFVIELFGTLPPPPLGVGGLTVGGNVVVGDLAWGAELCGAAEQANVPFLHDCGIVLVPQHLTKSFLISLKKEFRLVSETSDTCHF